MDYKNPKKTSYNEVKIDPADYSDRIPLSAPRADPESSAGGPNHGSPEDVIGVHLPAYSQVSDRNAGGHQALLLRMSAQESMGRDG